MELIIIAILAVLMPIMCIASFIVGYNVNAQKKIFRLPAKKPEPSEDELLLESIENAKVYDTRV